MEYTVLYSVDIFRLRRLGVSQNLVFRYNLPMRNRGYMYCVQYVEKNWFDPVVIFLW
jgi:hypothetical protein